MNTEKVAPGPNWLDASFSGVESFRFPFKPESGLRDDFSIISVQLDT